MWVVCWKHCLQGVFVFPRPRPWPCPPILNTICIYRPRPSSCIYRLPIRIYWPWLITMGNNKSKRLHIMLPFLFLEIKQKVNYRSIRSKVFCKKGVLRYFTKFTGKHLCQSLFFNEVAGLSPATLLKKRLWHRCIAVNFVEFLRTPFLHRSPLVAASEIKQKTDWEITLTTINEVKQKKKQSEINWIKLKKTKIHLKQVLNQCSTK